MLIRSAHSLFLFLLPNRGSHYLLYHTIPYHNSTPTILVTNPYSTYQEVRFGWLV